MALFVEASPSARVITAAGADIIRTLTQFVTTTGVTLSGAFASNALPATPTEIISAANNTIEAEWIKVTAHGMSESAQNTNGLLNIYIGGAGGETLFIDSLCVGWSATAAGYGLPRTYWFPVRIPRGTRVSGALRSIRSLDTCEVIIELGVSNGTHWVGSGVETLGENTAVSRGTSVTDNTLTTIGTSGRRYRYLQLGIQGNNDTTLTNTYWAWRIRTASADLQRMSMRPARTDAVEAHSQMPLGWFCDIASGTSLEVIADAEPAPSGIVYATLHGVY